MPVRFRLRAHSALILAPRPINHPVTMIAPAAQPLSRDRLLGQLRAPTRWDAVVIGGGATGLGIALDAAARGMRVALIEQRDFSSGTSSRSSKLIHGGVRYLAQGNFALVREALAERAVLSRIAPGLVRPLEFVVPCYRVGERALLRAGLGLYDQLAGSASLGPTRWLTRRDTAQRLPGVSQKGLRGGVSYWDAQFDDAAMAIALMQTACALGAVAVNYVTCEQFKQSDGRIACVVARDAETGERFELTTRCVFNAAGPWADALRADALSSVRPVSTVSQGSHVVVDRRFMPGRAAMLVPRTSDGRVLFVLPWYGALLIGTTDLARSDTPLDPRPSRLEVRFLLDTAAGFLERKPTESDVQAAFSGLRPLLSIGRRQETSRLSREHVVLIELGNLVTVVGGKWTTYRRMAEDAVDAALRAGLLPSSGPSRTREMRLVEPRYAFADVDDFRIRLADPEFVDWTRRFTQARCEEDIRARRARLDFLDTTSTTPASASGPR